MDTFYNAQHIETKRSEYNVIVSKAKQGGAEVSPNK